MITSSKLKGLTGDLVPNCQPVQIAELAKSETYDDRNYSSPSAC